MARAQGARSQLAAAFETTYGTAPASGFHKMPFASSGLVAEQPLLASELLGHGRDPLARINDAVTADDTTIRQMARQILHPRWAQTVARFALHAGARRMRHNPDLKAKYTALIATGKPAKVALVALMRKLIILVNALIREDRKWEKNMP